MPRRRKVRRWVLVDKQGRYAIDEKQSSFVPELEEAHVFVSPPSQTVAVRPVAVFVELGDGAASRG